MIGSGLGNARRELDKRTRRRQLATDDGQGSRHPTAERRVGMREGPVR